MRRMFSLLLASSGIAVAQDQVPSFPPREGRPFERRERGPGPNRPGQDRPGPWNDNRGPRQALPSSDRVETGFVFIDGKFLERPYQVNVGSQGTTINERRINLPGAGGPHPGPSLADQLRSGGAVIVFGEHEAKVLSDSSALSLLRTLTSEPRDEQQMTRVLDRISDATERSQWRDWLTSYQFPPPSPPKRPPFLKPPSSAKSTPRRSPAPTSACNRSRIR